MRRRRGSPGVCPRRKSRPERRATRSSPTIPLILPGFHGALWAHCATLGFPRRIVGMTESIERRPAGFVARMRREDGFVYETGPCDTRAASHDAAQNWLHWYSNVSTGTVESIYYIVSVPDTWPGPPDGCHRYSGLRVKIGRARDVKKRLADLRTGTPTDLIIHALEPGSPQIERQRHDEFQADRRQGEWFSCSPSLTAHILNTWERNNALPIEHQIEILRLQDRIDMLMGARQAVGGAFDMINPSLDERWHGSVMVDLAYSGWRVSQTPRPGAIPISPNQFLRDFVRRRR